MILSEHTKTILKDFGNREDTPLIDFCKQTGTKLGLTANAVRIILLQNGKLEMETALPEKASKPARTSKVAAVESLVEALNDWEVKPDMEIISRMTGKAAAYFTRVLNGQTAT